MSACFDAVILADSPHARTAVLGLTLAERGRRVALKAGARRVIVVEDRAGIGQLSGWAAGGDDAALLFMRAGDQVVHVPLIEPLLRGTQPRRVAVGPEGYAGALWASGSAARAAIEALEAGRSDADLARAWTDAERIPHGEIACHAATTDSERAAAATMLLRLLVKPEDNPITRYVYRPISRPLTRLLVGTPVTPNQISIAVLLIGMVGCWFTARPDQWSLIIGAMLVLLAGFIDGSDGEIARLRLTSSKLGAWLDTVVDELTTTVYFVAIGYHTYLHYPEPWLIPSVAIGMVCYALTILGIYYFLIVVSKTGNSQHYVSDLEIVEGDWGLALRARPDRPSNMPAWLRRLGALLKHVVRRDFINLGALAVALFDGYVVIYAGMLAGGVVSAAVIVPGHIRLRGQLRELARRGAAPRLVSS